MELDYKCTKKTGVAKKKLQLNAPLCVKMFIKYKNSQIRSPVLKELKELREQGFTTNDCIQCTVQTLTWSDIGYWNKTMWS